MFLNSRFILRTRFRDQKQIKRSLAVLGIETSCDDTGCAVVTDSGKILADSLHSQALIHLRNGGIIPPIARDLHVQHIEGVVNEAISKSGLEFKDLHAIAATVKPGLSLPLLVGSRYGQKLAMKYNKPFIPIHHMEAHALSVRMLQDVKFPFLVLLISGGHCLLAVGEDVNKFILLGTTLDDAPGEAFDKVGRRLKLTNLPEFRNVGAGLAIERLAQTGDPNSFSFMPVLMHEKHCDFSFSGIKSQARRLVIQEEEKYDVAADGVIPSRANLCASFQHAVTRHLCHRVQRAMEYVDVQNLIPKGKRCLVVAGGVACNQYISKMLKKVCSAMEYTLAVPPPPLCTDNGLMIAWNGVEKLRRGIDIIPSQDALTIDIEARCPFGIDDRKNVQEADIKCKWVKLLDNPSPASPS